MPSGLVVDPTARGATLRRILACVPSAWIAYPVIAVALVVVSATNEWTNDRTSALIDSRSELTQMRLQAMESLQLLTDAEAAQRGYLITGREEYLQPYYAALAELPRKLEPTLTFLARFAQSGDVGAAGQLVDAKLRELAAAIDLRRAGKTTEALVVIDSDIGRVSMDRIRVLMDRAFEVGTRQRDQARREIRHSLELRRWAIHALALLLALALVAYLRRTWASAAQSEVERERLEDKVRARTSDLRALMVDLRARTTDLRALAANLQTLQEDERARLARELHDELGGLLTAVKFDLARATRAVDVAQATERIAQASRRIDEVISIKRRIIEHLRPSSLDHLGLSKALETLCHDVRQGSGIAVTARLDRVLLPADAQIAVYRLVQEALTNIQKHAKAQQVELTMSSGPDTIEVAISDDGAGFDLVSPHLVGRHGLAGMRYRVEALGGELKIRSLPGHGTRIVATLPLARQRKR